VTIDLGMSLANMNTAFDKQLPSAAEGPTDTLSRWPDGKV
jgi:hypothetical protein